MDSRIVIFEKQFIPMRSKRFVAIIIPILILVSAYFMGPKPETPVFNAALPQVPTSATSLMEYIANQEAKHVLKPGNEAHIVWHDSSRQRTPYAVVYLHGFSASQHEGYPTHVRFAKDFGCNLYLSRLADHGIDTTEALLFSTADRLWESAKEALAIGKQLGEKVIIMSTSTGGSLALMLAAEYPDDVFALINMSPNIAINNGAAGLLNDPWGLYIARMVMGGKNRVTDATAEEEQYWNKTYRLEAAVELQELLEQKMNEQTFSRVTQPTLTLYYYKSETEQDPEVKVSAMLEMNAQLATPDSLKQTVAIPNAGVHVIGSSMTSKDIESVYTAIEKFALEKLQMSTVL